MTDATTPAWARPRYDRPCATCHWMRLRETSMGRLFPTCTRPWNNPKLESELTVAYLVAGAPADRRGAPLGYECHDQRKIGEPGTPFCAPSGIYWTPRMDTDLDLDEDEDEGEDEGEDEA